MDNHKRLDIIVMELRGFSRTYAREVIVEGLVTVNGARETRPGHKTAMANVEVQAPDMAYVSRGGYKLARALEVFGVVLNGAVCLDAGASTGGFTDCMLKNGAAHVYAADVGSGQLDAAIRADRRVTAVERTDIRALALPGPADFAAADLSFISLTKVLPSLARLIKPGGGLVCLIKPQFETEGKALNKRGVVTCPAARETAKRRVITAMEENGFCHINTCDSPILGRNGNAEYLAYGNKRY